MSILLVPHASAHPPYERMVRTLGDASTGEVTLFKSFVDGILVADPVKLVVRNAAGITVGETGYARDLAIICGSSIACAVYQYDNAFTLFPLHTWRLTPAGLRPDDSTGLKLIGIVAPYLEHWLGYLIAVGCFFVPLAALKALRRPTGGSQRYKKLFIAGFAAAMALVWLYLIAALAELSFPLVAALIAAVFALRASIRRWINSSVRKAATHGAEKPAA